MPELVRGVVLLNSAGQFGDASTTTSEPEETGLKKYILDPLKVFFQRIVLGFLFWQAKQPARVESVLKSVRLKEYQLFTVVLPCKLAHFLPSNARYI